MIDALINQALSAQIQAQIAALPRKDGAIDCEPRGAETSATLHYSGVIYADRSRDAELRRIISEAADHLRRNWRGRPGGTPIYARRYMYDLVVLTDGTIVRANAERRKFWHTGNTTANGSSWSIHVLLGPGQKLSDPQRASLGRLFAALALPVYGHCEWPRGDGAARPATDYVRARQVGQSECPGPLIHADLVSYRQLAAGAPSPAPLHYSADSPLLGHGRATKAQIAAYFLDPIYDLASRNLIASEYIVRCAGLGLNHDLAVAQCGHETGRLTSWWCERPRRNPAGLGVTGTTSPLAQDAVLWARDGGAGYWRQGLSFDAWVDSQAADGAGSITHHLGRLLAYALPAGHGNPAQEAAIAIALARRDLPAAYRGSAPTLRGLNGRWAYPGQGYADGIARSANALLQL